MSALDPEAAAGIVEGALAGARATGRPALASGGEAAELLRAGGVRALAIGGGALALAGAEGIAADMARLPLRERSIGAVVDVGAFHGYARPEEVVREWARVLAPRGALALADQIEKETDAAGFFSALAGARHMKSGEIGALVEGAGFEVARVAIYRVRRPLGEVAADPGALERAADEARALYEIEGDTITCRFLLLLAKRSAS